MIVGVGEPIQIMLNDIAKPLNQRLRMSDMRCVNYVVLDDNLLVKAIVRPEEIEAFSVSNWPGIFHGSGPLFVVL